MSDTQTTTAIERHTREPAPLAFDAAQRKLIIDSFMPGATEREAVALITTAERMGLDPFRRQIHFVKRRAKNELTEAWEERWAFQVAIDGFRSRAEDSGEYEGQDEPVFTFEPVINPMTGEDTGRKQLVARVTVHRKGRRPAVGVARWLEFAQVKANGQPFKMWADKPHHMLAKCAEALALRLAFPERLGGLYTDDEMGRDEDGDGRTVAPGVSPLASVAQPQAAKPQTVAPGFTGDEAKDIAAHVAIVREAKTAAEMKATRDAAHRRWPNGAPAAVSQAYSARRAELWPDAVKPAATAPQPPPKPAACDGNHAEPPCGSPGCWLAPPPDDRVIDVEPEREMGQDG